MAHLKALYGASDIATSLPVELKMTLTQLPMLSRYTACRPYHLSLGS